jgi:Glycoside-hydrolase family GH114
MRSTLVVACFYAGVALSTATVETTEAHETTQEQSPFWGGSSGSSYGPSAPFPWGKPQKQEMTPTWYASPPGEQRSKPNGMLSWLGWGSNSESGGSPFSSSPSSGNRGGFMNGLFGGGRKENGNHGNRPQSNNTPKPNPWAGLGGLGGLSPETPQPLAPETPEVEASPFKSAPDFAPSAAEGDLPRVPKLGSNPSPWGYPKTDRPSPKPLAAPDMGGMEMGEVTRNTLWQPQVAEPFQIILSGEPDVNVKLMPDHVNIFDIDLFNTPAKTIKELRRQNKKVICYFSAGSSEDWRPDYKQFTTAEMGNRIAKDDKGSSYWEGERWLNIKNPNPNSANLPNIWKIMRSRIKLAAEKGCNAIDPDNTGRSLVNQNRVTKANRLN